MVEKKKPQPSPSGNKTAAHVQLARQAYARAKAKDESAAKPEASVDRIDNLFRAAEKSAFQFDSDKHYLGLKKVDKFMDFYQFYNLLHGEKPRDSGYELGDYVSQVTSNKVNDASEDSTWQLKPLNDDDMKRYAAEDVEEWMQKYGSNTTKLGAPMSDDELKKHMGLR